MKKLPILASLLFGMNFCFADALTPKGNDLKQFLANLKVEERWLPGQYVHWKTGIAFEPTKTQIEQEHLTSKSHCSAYVAAVALRLEIPFLNQDTVPKDQVWYLSNFQNSWLNSSSGSAAGWKPTTAILAEKLADQGELVVATIKNENPKKSGHIAIVVPDASLTPEQIAMTGPEITQAGSPSPKVPAGNAVQTDTVSGFYFHTHGKLDGIQFFHHVIPTALK